jgi:hypothetical protein
MVNDPKIIHSYGNIDHVPKRVKVSVKGLELGLGLELILGLGLKLGIGVILGLWQNHPQPRQYGPHI